MAHHFEIELKAHPAEARRARACTREQLQHWGLDQLVETAELLVSELVGNAVVHTTTPALLRLSYLYPVSHYSASDYPASDHPASDYPAGDDPTSHVVRLEVSDTSDKRPRPRHAAPDDEAGRGLELVTLFSDRWNWHTHEAGKTVWCEIGTPAGATAS